MMRCAVLWMLVWGASAWAGPKVKLDRLPEGGLQPQIKASADGTLHMLFFKGDPKAGNLFYFTLKEDRLSEPIRVNGRPGSAMAVGTIRGAHLAVGKNGRAHVAWMGSARRADGQHPMWYARMKDGRRGFEPERDLLDKSAGLDGGGSIAADDRGRVYVVWHGTAKGADPKGGERARAVWVRTSEDEGKTFGPEVRADRAKPLGACGCCGLRARADDGRLVILYRAAEKTNQRDMRLLSSADGRTFKSRPIDTWAVQTCPMSSSAAAPLKNRWALAWETDRRVHLGLWNPAGDSKLQPYRGPLKQNCKHPALAVSKDGHLLLVWAEGTGWKRGGAVAWRLFDPEGRPVPGGEGRRGGLPAWSKPAAAATANGDFKILY